MIIFFRMLQFVIFYSACTILCYVPFKEKLSFSKAKLKVMITALFCVVLAAYISVLVFVPNEATQDLFLFALPICGAFYLLSFRDSGYRKVLVLLLVACYAAFICGCSAFIANIIFDKGKEYEILYTIATLFVGGVTYVLGYRFMQERFLPMVNLAGSKELQSICFMLLFYSVIQVAFFCIYDSLEQMSDLAYFVVLVVINILTYFVIMNILYFLSTAEDKKRMQEEISVTGKLLELQKSQYASWVLQIEAVRRARHDLKHHVGMIQTFLDTDDKHGLQEYVKEFQQNLPEASPMLLCKNIDVNAILLHYYERARKENIRLELLVDIDEDIKINSQDLAVVFGNCIENAFEACARMDENEEKVISLMAKPMGQGIAIVMDNTYNGHADIKNNVYLSSKGKNRVGVGLESVKLIVQKYAGVVSFETKGNLFMTSIRLGGQPAKGVVEGEK